MDAIEREAFEDLLQDAANAPAPNRHIYVPQLCGMVSRLLEETSRLEEALRSLYTVAERAKPSAHDAEWHREQMRLARAALESETPVGGK
jgi:hypothetical protein